MKNQKEIYKALYDGETLINSNGMLAKLNEGGDLVQKEPHEYLLEAFDNSGDWQIHKESEWHENIPDGNVLCWVSDIPNDSDATIRSVTGYCDDSTHFFETLEESWVHAKPLEKQEIQIYLDNAPEEI